MPDIFKLKGLVGATGALTEKLKAVDADMQQISSTMEGEMGALSARLNRLSDTMESTLHQHSQSILRMEAAITRLSELTAASIDAMTSAVKQMSSSLAQALKDAVREMSDVKISMNVGDALRDTFSAEKLLSIFPNFLKTRK